MEDPRSNQVTGPGGEALFINPYKRKHPRLFLPKYLTEEAQRLMIDPAELERAGAILKQWANAALEGHLTQKETSLDAEFLQKIFGEALNYKSISDSPNDYHREKNPTVPGAGIADGALGLFASGKTVPPTVIIELKGANTDLDHDKTNGRTPVQQCWDYLNQLPQTQWGIVSNYVTIRLYHKSHPQRAYDEFTVGDFLDPVRVREFYYVFEKQGLLGTRTGNTYAEPRAVKLLNRTQNQQREVGDKLYNYYSRQREHLIGELMDRNGMSQDLAIHAAQRLLDRIIFMAFCEDRGLLPPKLIESTWKNVAPLARATNPRWRNFLDAFHAIDQGHARLDLPKGYNGGLFKHDPLVDELDLDDRWADVFKNIGDYDFREEGEISVDVLGHIFERSITELEKLRVVGLFGSQAGEALGAMPKSAERKRFGIYYTPPDFTRLIVEETLGKLIAERVDPLPDLQQRIAEMRKLKVVDPACGSGAFLIAAYERLEDAYEEIARQMRIAGHLQDAVNLTNAYADYILFENLYGVDLSAESVEITQLALWIRSARKGRTLVDLSSNIRRGNSLIADRSIHAEAFDWQAAFPAIFANGGFDAVIGNPPWERMKVQEREFFSLAAPEIAASVNAADRRKLIATIEAKSPGLWSRYTAAQQAAERTLAYVRSESANFPLTGRGDVNTYMLFAELARRLVSPTGRVGLLVPSGIATDNTTRVFFADLMESKTLAALFDFENRKPVFADVDGRFKFSVLLMSGTQVRHEHAQFVFFAHTMKDLADTNRHIRLSPRDLKLLNPNTRTCPIFRTRRDAEITKRIYRTIPILVDQSRKSGGNPWGVKFCRMFDQTNDAEHFITGEKLKADGYTLDGNRWIKKKDIYLPLYEAKMIQAYDHRAAGVRIAAGNWMRQGQPEETSLVEHQNPEFVAQPRYWVSASTTSAQLKGVERIGLIGFKDITSATNRRTMIASAIPFSAVTNHFPLLLSDLPWRRQFCLLGNLNSLAYDYVTRQKVGAITLNFFIVEQLPTLPPDAYDEKCPWAKSRKLEDWIADRVLKLTCTANDMLPVGHAAGFTPGVWKWKDEERAQLRAELDAAYFHLYRLTREDVEYILGTFQGIAREDEQAQGEGFTRRLILEAYDAMQ
ncbi:MAG TPA: DNA methyltransferase [Tepidisphaeraceae bacterium]|nr:DNA methyltransferase [Tepidisphaeraceae bacterium]